MEIILLEKIDNMGGIGDRVTVKPGYARNYLIPQGKATFATAANIAKFEGQRAELERKAAEELSVAQARAERLLKLEIVIPAQAGSEGRLFGSVGTADIARACSEQGMEIERSEVRLPEGPLRVAGEHEVDFHLHADVNVTLKVLIDAGETAPAAPLTAEEDEADLESED